MGELFTHLEIYDVLTKQGRDGDVDLEIGVEIAAAPVCYVDSGSNRTVMAEGALDGVRTLPSPERARLFGQSWPIRLVWMKLAHRGCQPRLIQVAVSSEIIERSDVDEALVIVGQDYLQRDRVGLRFNDELDMHGIRCGTRRPMNRTNVFAIGVCLCASCGKTSAVPHASGDADASRLLDAPPFLTARPAAAPLPSRKHTGRSRRTARWSEAAPFRWTRRRA